MYSALRTTLILLLVLIPGLALAQDYQPLTGIPNVPESGAGVVDYVNALYLLGIALGGMFAVIKLAFAGLKLATAQDNIGSRQSAKQDIQGALLGLAILLGATLVLQTIYPNLISLDVLGRFGGASVIESTQDQGAAIITSREVREVCTHPENAPRQCQEKCVDKSGTFRPSTDTSGVCTYRQ